VTGALQAAIVDLDGTMVDTLGDFDVALNRTLAELALPPVDRVFIERTVGKGSEHLIRSILAAVGGDAVLYDAAWAHYQRHYRAINGDCAVVYDGVELGLERLREAGLPLACVTNKPRAFATELLERKGLAGYFSHVFGGDSFERRKPDPLPFVRAAAALGSVPQRTLVIGDSANDAIAARAAGCPVVLVSYGYNHGEPVVDAGADAVVDRLDGIELGRFDAGAHER
jgi:phosphoglycolate phosphatase